MTDYNENVEYCEAEFIEDFEDEGVNGSLIGVGVALGVGALAAGAAFVANKKGFFDDFKAKRAAKKVEKLEKKLEKAYTTIEKYEVEEKSEDKE